MRLGILGGTFDPIHFGHLRTAEEVGEIFELEKVFLIPSKKPPHKKEKPVSPFFDRINMLRLAIKGSRRLDVLDIEGKRPGYSYTIDTLRDIASNPCFGKAPDIYFILGIDAFMEINTWKNYRELFHYSNFVIVNRLGYDSNIEDILEKFGIRCVKRRNKRSFCLDTGKSLFFISVTFMDISSSQIRKLITNGRSVSFLLPEEVKEYILKKGLYRDEVY